MNLKDFQRVIDTCTKMKEIIIFSELILDDENAALSLKENATQTISLLNVWVRRAATWTSLQQLEELLFFSERFIQAEVADALQKAKAADAQNCTLWYHDGLHDFGKSWNEVPAPGCIRVFLSAYKKLLAKESLGDLTPDQEGCPAEGEGMLTYRELSNFSIRFLTAKEAIRFNITHMGEQMPTLSIYKNGKWH